MPTTPNSKNNPSTPSSRRETRSRTGTPNTNRGSAATTPTRKGRTPDRDDRSGSNVVITSPLLQRLPVSPGQSLNSGQEGDAASVCGSEMSSRIDYNEDPTSRGIRSSPKSPSSGSNLRSTSRMSQRSGGQNAGGGGAASFARGRADIDSYARHHRKVDVQNPTALEGAAGDASTQRTTQEGPQIYIWGTRICVADVQQVFKRFIRTYTEPKPDEDEIMIQGEEGGIHEADPESPYYMQRLDELSVTMETHLNINLQHLSHFDEAMYKRVICYPADVIPYLDIVANEVFKEEYPDLELPFLIEVRLFNANKTRNMRGLNPEDIDQLITITGMVIRTSFLIPEMRQGFFQCTVCNDKVEVEVDRGRIEEPTVCRNCNNTHVFQLVHNRSIFMDKQIVKLQESPDDMPAGQTPHTVTMFAHGNLVDTVQPGDRVTVTGIYRANPLRLNPRMRVVKSVYKTHIDVLHFRRSHTDKLHSQDDGAALSADRLAEIEALSKKPDIYERLAHALAPSIFEHDDIKKGILCLLFGGSKKDLSKAGRSNFRSELNILLCGDPGTSKSQLLQYVHNLVPRSQYTSGKGSSAVGLTAYVTRDPDTKHFVLQTGALVLSDNGVCCIDEFDKMNDGTRAVLHEVMEQQTLSIAKAGIICQLNARASILAAANPVDSQWNKDKTIIENLQLPHTLLSRFDLIFLLVDPQDEHYDRRLATHLCSLYYKTKASEDAETLDMSLIRDYIEYAKRSVRPVVSEEAGQLLIEKYLEMRKIGSGRGQVSAYPRQLESLIRLSEAHAKIHLQDTVTESDVEEAHRLHREALKQSAMDPATGRIDVNILSSGVSATTRKHINELAGAIKQHIMQKPMGTHFMVKKMLLDLKEKSDRTITSELYQEALGELLKNETIIRTGDKIRLINA